MAFFTSKNDSSLVNSFLLNSPDMYVAKVEFEGTAVYDVVSGTNDKFIVSTASWTVDSFNSAGCLNLEIIDNAGAVFIGKVADTTATEVVFDKTALVPDAVSGTVSLTDGGSYTIRILSPNASYAYGDFFGYTSELSFNPEQETAEFKYGIPRDLIREDLIENMGTLSGSCASMSNSEIIKAIFGMGVYGSQTSQTQLASGTASFNNSYYRIALKADDVNAKTTTMLFHKVKIKAAGEIALSEEGYKMIPFECKVFTDTMRPSTSANRWRWIKAA